MNLLIQEKNKTFNNYALLLDSFGSDTKIGHGFSNENVFLVIYLIKTILTILLDTTTVTYSISVNLLFHQESQIVMPRAIRPIKLRVLGSAQESWKEWCFLRMYAYQQCSSSKPNPLCRLSLSYKMPFWNPALSLLSHVLPTSCAGMYFCSYFTDIQTEAQT